MQKPEKSDTTTPRQKQRRGGLGRGLGSLIPTAPVDTSTSSSADTSLQQVPLDNIQPNPYQPRLHMQQEQ